jgi:hypothetical protein
MKLCRIFIYATIRFICSILYQNNQIFCPNKYEKFGNNSMFGFIIGKKYNLVDYLVPN